MAGLRSGERGGLSFESQRPNLRWRLPALAIMLLLSGCMSQSATEPTAPSPPSGWTSLFQDTFSGPAGAAPATATWRYDLGPGSSYGSGEIEHYTRSTSNVFTDGAGSLVIQANRSAGQWTSGRIETNRDDFAPPAGGELEMTASIELPEAAHALGYWPAFWAVGSTERTGTKWPAVGELDMMEDVNGLNAASQTMHDAAGQSGHQLIACPASGCNTGYHTYSVIINRTDTQAEYLTFLIDGQVEEKMTAAEVGATAWRKAIHHGFFIILDLAMGGSYPNSSCGCQTPTAATTSGAAMKVRYVAVYQKAG